MIEVDKIYQEDCLETLKQEVLEHRGDLKLNGKTVYERLIIRRKQL